MCYYNFYTSFSFHFFLFILLLLGCCCRCCCDDVEKLLNEQGEKRKRKERAMWIFFPFIDFSFACWRSLCDLISCVCMVNVLAREKVLEIERSLRWSAESFPFVLCARFKLRKKFIIQFVHIWKAGKRERERKKKLQRRMKRMFFINERPRSRWEGERRGIETLTMLFVPRRPLMRKKKLRSC